MLLNIIQEKFGILGLFSQVPRKIELYLDMEDADVGMEGLASFCGDKADEVGGPTTLRWCSLFRFRSISFSIISFMVRAEPIWGKLTSEGPEEDGGTVRLYLSVEVEMTTPEKSKKIVSIPFEKI